MPRTNYPFQFLLLSWMGLGVYVAIAGLGG